MKEPRTTEREPVLSAPSAGGRRERPTEDQRQTTERRPPIPALNVPVAWGWVARRVTL